MRGMPSSVACILLTTHPKRAKYLPDALCSYREQTYPNKRLIVVNDGAPLESRASDVVVVNLPDDGRRWTIGEKRNVGVRTATEDFVATFDDDDISLPNRLADQVAFAEKYDADYVLADKFHAADADMNVMGVCDRGRARAVMPSALIRRCVIERAGGYSASDYREDVELMERIRYLCRGKVIRMDGCDWYVFRRHESNVTLSFGERGESYIECGLRGPNEKRAAEMVRMVRLSSGKLDVVPSSA